MNVDKIVELKENIYANLTALKSTEVLEATKFLDIDKLIALIESVSASFENSSDLFYLSDLVPEFIKKLTDIKSQLDNNIVPYLSSPPHKNHLSGQIPVLRGYVSYLQNLLVKVVVLNEPLRRRGMLKPTETMIKSLDKSISLNVSNIEEYNRIASSKITELNKKLLDLETKIDKLDTTNQKNMNLQLDNLKNEIITSKATLLKLTTDFTKDTTELIKESEDKIRTEYNRAKEITDIISDSAQASEYGKSSKNYMWAKRVWQSFALLFLVLTSLVGIFSILPLRNIDLIPSDIYQIILRVIIALSLGSGAAYSARQAHKNFRLEVRTKLIYLDLLTIDSFIRDTDNPKQLKSNLVEKYFGRHEYFDTNDNEDDIILNAKNLKEVIEILNKLNPKK